MCTDSTQSAESVPEDMRMSGWAGTHHAVIQPNHPADTARASTLVRLRNAQLRVVLEQAYDAIAHAENYHQEPHVAEHLRKAKLAIVDALHIDGKVCE